MGVAAVLPTMGQVLVGEAGQREQAAEPEAGSVALQGTGLCLFLASGADEEVRAAEPCRRQCLVRLRPASERFVRLRRLGAAPVGHRDGRGLGGGSRRRALHR